MKINKNQALYKALPGSWYTYSDSETLDYKYSCRIKSWNADDVKCSINREMMKNDIVRQVSSFQSAGGAVDDSLLPTAVEKIRFVEPLMKENIPDIVCDIDPTTFYCGRCGLIVPKPRASSAPLCPKCHIKTKQLGMVYACECGFADGVKPPYNGLYYRPKDETSQFKFYSSNGARVEMEKICPLCKRRLLARNSTDHRILNPQSGSLVNLYNEKFSQLLSEYKIDAELLMLAKWYGIISNDQFKNILDRPKDFFEAQVKSVDDKQVQMLAKVYHTTPKEILKIMNAADEDNVNFDVVKQKVEEYIPTQKLGDKLRIITPSSISSFSVSK